MLKNLANLIKVKTIVTFVVLMVFAINITLAYICLKLYDEPVRRWLTKRFIKTTK